MSDFPEAQLTWSVSTFQSPLTPKEALPPP